MTFRVMRTGASVRKMAVAVSNRWYFTKEQLKTTPSIRAGVDPEKELSYRQQAATLIQDMGQRLSVSQLTINTAIVYMHRFYMYHCFSKFHRNVLAPCCLFLAAKVEEQPRKLEHVITVAHRCLHRGEQALDIQSEEYMQKAQDLVENESVLLQTLGFECTVHHPHTYVVKCIQLVRASKDLGQTSYFMATNSLHLTTLCLQYKPPVVACACIHLACKWSNWEIPQSSDNKNWWEYIDPSVNKDLLDEIAQEFIHILDKCPSRLKKKIHSVPGGQPIKLPRTENSSSKVSNSSSSGASSSMRTVAQNSVDGTQNGVGGNGNDTLTHMSSKQERGKPRVKEQSLRDEREQSKDKRQEPDKLKPLPANASVHSVSGSTASTVSTTVTLPPLLPLITKYATVTVASQMPISDAKGFSSLVSGSSTSTTSASHSKHKHHLQSEASPAKKHKSSHSHRPHSSSQKLKTSDMALTSIKVPHTHKSSNHSHKRPHPHSGHHGVVSGHLSHKPHSSHHHHTSSSHKTHHGHTHHPSSKSSADLAKRHSSSGRSESQAKLQAVELPPPPPPPPVAVGSSLPLPPTSLSSQQRFLAPVTGVIQSPMAVTSGQLPMSFMPGMFPGIVQGQAMVSRQDSFRANSLRAQGINPFGQISPVITGATPPPPPPPGPGPSSPPPPPPPPLP